MGHRLASVIFGVLCAGLSGSIAVVQHPSYAVFASIVLLIALVSWAFIVGRAPHDG